MVLLPTENPSRPGRLLPLSPAEVVLSDRFWVPRLQAIRARTLPSQYDNLRRVGVFDQLEAKYPAGPYRIPIDPVHGITHQMFWDSDVAKWIEAASYLLAQAPDPALSAKIDDFVARLAAAQCEDGYLNTFFLSYMPDKRWTNLRDTHELYCAGHLIEAAVAHVQATGQRQLLDIMCRYVDHIAGTFGPGPGQKRGYPGHEEIELALVRLYHVTGERRHLDLARYFIDERGRQPHYFDAEARARGDDPARYAMRSYEYSQSHVPVREQDTVVGHAVRAMYLYCGMADLARETGDPDLKQACERLWQDVTTKRLYVTAGMGDSAGNEGFTSEYNLPNDSAYAETCAAVGLVFWAHRMLHLDCDGRYADMMELALYNGALSGLSQDGEHYFYDNKLESRGDHHRWRWHSCPCCPPNITRLVASVGQYAYSAGEREIAVHLYAEGSASLRLPEGTVRLVQRTDYPWNGENSLRFEGALPARFTLALRIPGWCRTPRLSVNGDDVDIARMSERGYVRLDRVWTEADLVQLSLPMPVERLRAHPEVRADTGRVALKRGPLVYCLETADNPAAPRHVVLPNDAPVEDRFAPDLLGGCVTLSADALFDDPGAWQGMLYSPDPPEPRRSRIVAIPYHLWDHRQPGEMLVWLRAR